MTQKNKYAHIQDIDFNVAAEAHRKQGGSIYTMILEGAARARDIAKQRNLIDAKNEKLTDYGLKPINQALYDMVEDYKSGTIDYK